MRRADRSRGSRGSLGLARNTVRSAIRSPEPPGYRRASRGSVVAIEKARPLDPLAVHIAGSAAYLSLQQGHLERAKAAVDDMFSTRSAMTVASSL